jgi:hypothetical protein
VRFLLKLGVGLLSVIEMAVWNENRNLLRILYQESPNTVSFLTSVIGKIIEANRLDLLDDFKEEILAALEAGLLYPFLQR